MYALKTETRTIGDVEVSVTEIDCFAQQDLWIALTQEAAPGLGGIGQLLSDGFAGLSEHDVSALLPMLLEALKGLNAKKLKALQLQTFASASAVVESKMVPLAKEEGVKMAFGPHLDLMWEAFVFAVEVLFARFFARLRSWMSAMKAKVEAAVVRATLEKASRSTSAQS